MKIEIANTCTNKEVFESSLDRICYIIHNLMHDVELKSVEYLIIADTESEKYHETILHYAKKFNINVAPTNDSIYDVTGKCICGIDDSGMFKQFIILKSAVINILLLDYAVLCEKQLIAYPEYEKVQWLGLTITLHEFGHAIDNEIMYSNYHLVNTEKGYDLSIISEQEKYFLDGAISLWGEFFAESFVYMICPTLRSLVQPKANELVNCFRTYFGANITPFDRAYQILYLFVHTIAEQGEGIFDYSILADYPTYIPYLQKTEEELFNLLKLRNTIDLNKKFCKLKVIFNRLCGL